MAEQNKAITTSSQSSSLFPAEIFQWMGMAMASSMVDAMLESMETEHLTQVLGRRPNDWDRFAYRSYVWSLQLSHSWQQRCSDNQKLWQAACRDVGMLR